MVKNHVLVTVISPKNIEASNNNKKKKNCLYEIYFDWETIKRKVKKIVSSKKKNKLRMENRNC